MKLWVILLILTIIITGTIYFYNNKINTEKTMDFKVQSGNYNVEYPKFTYTKENVDLGNVKEIISRSNIFEKIPEDAIIVIEFFDGNGNPMNKGVTVYGSGKISDSIDSKNDFEIITGNYYLESTDKLDVCNIIKKIRENKDYRISTTKSRVELLWKYRVLVKECII